MSAKKMERITVLVDKETKEFLDKIPWGLKRRFIKAWLEEAKNRFTDVDEILSFIAKSLKEGGESVLPAEKASEREEKEVRLSAEQLVPEAEVSEEAGGEVQEALEKEAEKAEDKFERLKRMMSDEFDI
jgi:hypothetical protein